MKQNFGRYIMIGMTATVAIRIIAKSGRAIIDKDFPVLIGVYIGVVFAVWLLWAFWAGRKWTRYFLGYGYLVSGVLGVIGRFIPPQETGFSFVGPLLEDLWYTVIGASVAWGPWVRNYLATIADPPLSKSNPSRRALRIAFFIWVGLMLAFVCIYRIGLSLRVKDKIAAIRKAGSPSTLAELNKSYPEVLPEENAAIILTNAFAYLVRGDTNSANLPLVGKGKLPPRAERMSEEMKQAVAEHLELNRKALELLHEGLKLKKCRYPIDLTQGHKTLLPHLSKVRRSAELLSLKAALHVENGEPGKAVDCVTDTLALADTLRSEPLLISAGVMLNCQTLACSEVDYLLNHIALRDPPLAELQALFHQAEAAASLVIALAGERCDGLQMFDLSMGEIGSILINERPSKEVSLGERVPIYLGEAVLRLSGLWEKDRLHVLDRMGELLTTSQLPFPRRVAEADRLDSSARSQPKPYYHIISNLWLPHTLRSIQKETKTIACLRLTQAALALERFRLAHSGALPDSLRELSPSFLQTVPDDPYDGRPLRYRRRDPGYVVYSIADDGRDDGGIEWKSSKDPRNTRSPLAGYDWTFTVER